MRAGCYDCTIKHLGQAAVWTYMWTYEQYPMLRGLHHLSKAMVLQSEMHLGYQQHYGLFSGHLACASEELVAYSPEMARRIRETRLGWMSALWAGTKHYVDIEALVLELRKDPQLEFSYTPTWSKDAFRVVRQAKVMGHLSEAAEECMEVDADMAPQIVAMLGMWVAGVTAEEGEPDLQYEELFDSLWHRLRGVRSK